MITDPKLFAQAPPSMQAKISPSSDSYVISVLSSGDYLCVSSAAHISRRRNGVTDVNMTSSSGGDQTQSSTNISNSTEPTPHTDTTTGTTFTYSGGTASCERRLHADTTEEQTHLCGFARLLRLCRNAQAHKHTLFTYFPESALVLFSLSFSVLVLIDNSKVSTDPLLAGLVSAFVVVAAIVSVLIFLKFRNTSDGPEFHRLQDLPMDDMLEDAPLSMYSY
ncbi:uncharacterized protein LOC107719408 [Sinocyclocheilus rhinocerous]|uniref:uncharacterized protein LOC107719408 n=1 Tax=Sinocyclocheilus rhinocerous TaxID=307959 RepID=UPI0007BA4B21|nr:PREDICTED: uncharacterized protein LOC107719408 [Sinocyclocheilus rhinocerous]